MDLLDKLRAIEKRRAMFADGAPVPGQTVIDRVLGPGEVVVGGRPTLMFGSNNYLGLTLASRRDRGGAPRGARVRHRHDRFAHGQRHARAARGPRARVRRLVRQAARDHLQHRLPGEPVAHRRPVRRRRRHPDRRRQPREHLRRDAADGVAGRSASATTRPRACARSSSGCRRARNRLVVVEGLYSIRGDVAPLRDIVDVCRAHGAYILVDEAHSLGTYGPTGLGCAEEQGVLDEVDFVVGTFSKSLAGIGGVCVSNHPELRALHFLARAYVFTASGSPANVASVSAAIKVVRAHPGAARSAVGERPAAAPGAARAGLRDRRHRIADRADPDRRRRAHDRALAAAAERRALREPDRAARLPGRRLRAARELLGGAQPRTDHARARHPRARRRRDSASRASRCHKHPTASLLSDTTRTRRASPLGQPDPGDDAESVAQAIDAADESLRRRARRSAGC